MDAEEGSSWTHDLHGSVVCPGGEVAQLIVEGGEQGVQLAYQDYMLGKSRSDQFGYKYFSDGFGGAFITRSATEDRKQ